MAPRNVLVTGASTGIGEATALHLDAAGWRVFAGVRRDEDGERLRAAASSRLVPVRLDVTDEADIAAAFKAITEAVGGRGLDGLVNNAGVARGGPIEFLALSEWRNQFEVNVFGQLAVTQAAIDLLRTARGRVVFIGSISGRVATPMVGPYSASKHAIEAIGVALREELRPWSIEVAVVEPGVIKTPIWAKGAETADELERSLPAAALALYREPIATVRRSIAKNAEGGVEPVKVARAVQHALTATRPQHRYLVGPDARVAASLVRVLPDRVWARLARRLMAI